MCLKVQKTVQPLINCSVQEVQSDILSAEEVLHNARVSIGVSVHREKQQADGAILAIELPVGNVVVKIHESLA